MAIAVQKSMMASQPSPDLQLSLGLWRCFVVYVKGLDELQLLLAEPRSQPPVPTVGLPSLSGWPCVPPSSLVMPLIVKLCRKQDVVQGSLFWMTQVLVAKGFEAARFFVLKHDIWMEWLFVLKGARSGSLPEFVVDLSTEGFVRVGYVATLSVLLFVSCSGVAFALSWPCPSGWCRRASAFALRCAPSLQSSSFSCAAMLAAILSFDFSEASRNSKVVLEGLDENMVVFEDITKGPKGVGEISIVLKDTENGNKGVCENWVVLH